MISKGMMDAAKANARHNVGLLHAYAGNGMPIIGCEPSCLLTLRDEYPQLVPGEQSRTVASHAFLIDEFLAKLKAEGKLNIEFRDSTKQVLFHAHCHQRSLAGYRIVPERPPPCPRLQGRVDQRSAAAAWPAHSVTRRSTTTFP